MKILLSLLISLNACQTTMEIEEKKIISVSAKPNKPPVDWNVIFYKNIEKDNKAKKEIYTDQIKDEENPENELDQKPQLSHEFETLLDEANTYLSNHEIDYAFQILSQMKSYIDRQEYPFAADIYMYEYSLARAYLQNENFEQARNILIKLTKNDPKFIPGYVLLTDSYIKKNHLDAAEFILKRAISNNPNNNILQTKMASLMIQKTYYQSAYKWVAKTLKRSPDDTVALITRAGVSIKLSNYAAAENDLNAALKEDPNNDTALVTMGVLKAKTGRSTAAMDFLSKALMLNPNNTSARFNIALLSIDSDTRKAKRLLFEVTQSTKAQDELHKTSVAILETLNTER